MLEYESKSKFVKHADQKHNYVSFNRSHYNSRETTYATYRGMEGGGVGGEGSMT